MTFACLIRIGLAWLVAVMLAWLYWLAIHGDSLTETLTSNNLVPFGAAMLAGFCIGRRASGLSSPGFFVVGTVLFLSSLPLFAFLTDAPYFPAWLTGNKPFDYTVVYGGFYTAFAVLFLGQTKLQLKMWRLRANLISRM